MAAVVEFAADLLKQQRDGAPDRLRRSLDALRDLVPALAQSVHVPADVFRQSFLGKAADPQVAWSLQRMVSTVVHGDSHAGLKRAGEDLADARPHGWDG